VGLVPAAPDVRPGQLNEAVQSQIEVNQKILDSLLTRVEQLEAGRTREG
jgi:hypothetical protein